MKNCNNVRLMAQMTVIEVGVIIGSIPVFIAKYNARIKSNEILRSGMISAIDSFSKMAFDDKMEQLHLKNFRICVQTFSFQKLHLILYAIADLDPKKLEPVQSALQQVASVLADKKMTIHLTNRKKNRYLDHIFEKAFRYLHMNPLQRAKALFTI